MSESSPRKTPKFPLRVFPQIFFNIILEASRKSRLPVYFTAASCLSCVSVMLRSGIAAQRSPQDRKLRANLFCIFAAITGSGKGASDHVLQEPFRVASLMFRDGYKKLKKRLFAEKSLLEIKRKKMDACQAGKGEEPPLDEEKYMDGRGEIDMRLGLINALLESGGPVLDVTDATPSALIKYQAINLAYWECLEKTEKDLGSNLAIVSPDGADLLRWITPASTGKGDSVSQSSPLLKAWGGEQQKSARSTTDLGEIIESIASVAATVTPPALKKFLALDEVRTDGLCGRFLFVLHEGEYVDVDENDPPVNDYVRNAYLTAMMELFETFGMSGTRNEIMFTKAARSVIVEYENEVGRQTRAAAKDSTKDVRELTVRWAEIAGKIALILHCMEHGKAAARHEISEITAKNAVTLMRFFEEHTLTIVEPMREKQGATVEEKIAACLKKHAKDGVKLRRGHIDGVGKDKEESEVLFREAAAKGLCEIVYTWRNNQPTAVVVANGTPAYSWWNNQRKEAISTRLARGDSALHPLDPVHMDKPEEAKAEPEPTPEWKLELPPAAYAKQGELTLPSSPKPPINQDEAEEMTDDEIAAAEADLPI